MAVCASRLVDLCILKWPFVFSVPDVLVSAYDLRFVCYCVPRRQLVLCSFILFLSSLTWSRTAGSFSWYIPFLWAPARFSDYKFSFFRLDVYSCPMWSELTHVQTLVVSFGKLVTRSGPWLHSR